MVGVKTYCLVYNNITNQPLTCTKWGDIKKNDVPITHECTINQPSIIRTYLHELDNNTWNTIEWDVDNGYINEEGFKMDQQIQTYIEQSCLCLGMAGTGKSNILQEMPRNLSKNEVSKPFVTACPTHKACKHTYNNTKHSTTGLAPNEAVKPSNHFDVWLNISSEATYNRKYPPLEIGDKVRTYVKPKSMKKGTDSVWSKEVFEITLIKDKQYFINDFRRRVWNRHELLKVTASEGKDG